MIQDQSSAQSLTQHFAQWAHALTLESLPASVCEKAKLCFLDWLAALTSGAAHPAAATYIALAQKLGGTTGTAILARKEHTSTAFAIFAQAALGHITENDDGHRQAIMHPGNVVFPVVACLAPLSANPVKALIEGAVVGYEATIRLGVAFGPHHYTQWHTTATAGIFGAAAAAAKLLNLDARGIEYALGHAGTQAAGLWQFLEDGCVTAKPFHPAKSCLDGYIAAMTAREGIPGAAHILEGSKGLLQALGRPPMPETFLEGLGQYYKIEEVNVKGYPTCGQTHSMIDAMAQIRQKHSLQAQEVARIEVRVYEKAAQIAGNIAPQNLEEAKFSISFCLAYYILHGQIPFVGLSNNDVFREDVQSLMKKIHTVIDPVMSAGFPAARPCKIIVTTMDGRTLSADNAFRKGDPENPMSIDEISAKFQALAADVYSIEKIENIIETITAMASGKADFWPDFTPDK